MMIDSSFFLSHSLRRAAAVIAILGLAGCAVGPKYQRAGVPTPPAWSREAPWRTAVPQDSIPKGSWWSLYGDAELDGYEKQALTENQSIAAAVQRLQQARDLARIQVGGFFPTLGAAPSAERQRLSGNRPVVGT